MALTANTIPSQIGLYNSPVDAAMEFTTGETLTATGYMGSTVATVTLDLGGSNPAAAAGRHEGIWNILISAIDMASTDETYRFFLMGSNDAAWGNGNVELLAFHDLAAVTAGRIVATILGASPAIPPTNLTGTQLQILFSNQRQRILYRYLRGYVVIGGTTPSITYRSWISKADVKV
jgi:hypothetical protein